jgi:hypothetical protein
VAGLFLRALERRDGARRAPVNLSQARLRIRAPLGPDQLDVLDDPHRFVDILTPRGAGKSTAMVHDALDKMSATHEGRFFYGALTKDSGVENVIDEFARCDSACGLGLVIRQDAGIIRMPETGSTLRIRSIESRKEVDKIRGKQYDGGYLDECQSVRDDILRYALTGVIPQTLGRKRGFLKLAGTPTRTPVGMWHAITSRLGQVPRRFAGGVERSLSRPWKERELAKWQQILWTWSHHTWGRAANPGMADADAEAAYMKGALAVSLEDAATMEAEYGDWPEDDPRGREFRFNPLSDVWTPGARSVSNPFGLPTGHDWFYTLAADLIHENGQNDEFAVGVGASAFTSRVGYHVWEDGGNGLTIAEMASKINYARHLLGTKLVRMVGDSQGQGNETFLRLQIEHRLPLEKAVKRDKEDGIELVNSDLVAGRLKILAGSRVATQLEQLRKGPDGKRLKGQPDDFADMVVYMRRGMLHWAADDTPKAPDPEADRRARETRILADIARQQQGAERFEISAWQPSSWEDEA